MKILQKMAKNRHFCCMPAVLPVHLMCWNIWQNTLKLRFCTIIPTFIRELRLRRAYAYASAHKFDYFCTTLSISPFKDAEKINEIGERLAGEGRPRWLPSDFKKKSGFLRSLQLSEEYGLYRQQYCGCVFSKENTDAFRNEKC